MLTKISTGCATIDNILEGGIQFESVNLIYGEAETGKTTLATQCAINFAKKGYKTLFIDCDNTFSAQRMSQIASESFKEAAELVILMKPNTFREQTIITDKLTDYITRNFGLIVVDTVTSLYRARVAEYPGKTFELNRELNRQMALLAQVAKIEKIAVLMISQVRSAFSEASICTEPVATRVLKFWADTIIAMKPTENSQIIKAVLEKSPKKLQPLTVYLKIEKTGIHEYLIR